MNVVPMPSATQCAAVRIRSPVLLSSTAALHVCTDWPDPPPRNTAPTRGSGATGAAPPTALACGATCAPEPVLFVAPATVEVAADPDRAGAGALHDTTTTTMAAGTASIRTLITCMTTDLARYPSLRLECRKGSTCS